MTVTLGRQLTDDEKERVLQQHGRVCFATGHDIPDAESPQFDHIRAYATGGATEINNIAPMCAQHNREKGTLRLFDFRARLQLEEFFSKGDKLTLGNLLDHFKATDMLNDYGQPISARVSQDSVAIQSASFSGDFQLYKCPVTSWDYFYATLPVALLDSDDDSDQGIGLQPRYLIFGKVFDLFRHFQIHPVLQPSLGRITNGRIKLFDGQHKAAALLWNNRRELECKIYLDPEMRLLSDTNIDAHDKYSQTRFYTSIMVMKLGAQFRGDFDEYKDLEDGEVKSEAGFIQHLRKKDSLTHAEGRNRFRNFLYDSILKDEENHLSELISVTNRASESSPITLNGLTNSLFSYFLLREPVNDNMTTDDYKRQDESENMVSLMNMIYNLALDQWDPRASKDNPIQRRLTRMIRARFMKAWAEVLRDAICAKLELYDSDDKTKPLYRTLSEDQLKQIRECVARLVDWKMWDAPADSEIDRIRMDTDREVKDWIKQQGLTTGYLMGAPE